MVKLSGALFGIEARGSVGEALTYSKRATGQQVRFQRKQKDVITPNRTIQRFKFNLGLVMWRSMPDYEKYYWTIVEKQGFVDI